MDEAQKFSKSVEMVSSKISIFVTRFRRLLIFQIQKRVQDTSQAERQLKKQFSDQTSDLDTKRIKYLEDFGRLEEEVLALETKNAGKRVVLASEHHTNEQIGARIMKKKAEIQKLESLKRTFRETLDQMEMLAKEKKMTAISGYKSQLETM